MSRQDNSRLHGVAVFAALLLALTTSMAPLYSILKVNANGFTVLIAQGIAGPHEYLIGVWPPDPVVGKPLLMSIALSANQQPVTDASVNVTGTVNDQTVVGPRAATNSIAHPATYELVLALNTPGKWMFQVEIKSPLGEGVVEVPLEVTGSQGATDQAAGNRLIWTVIAMPLAILTFGLVAWGFKRKRPRPS